LCEAQQCKYWIHCVFFSFFLLVVADLFREYYLRPRKDSRVTTAEDGRRLKEERKPFGTHFLWNSTSLLKSVCSLFVSFSSSFPIVHIVHSRNLVELLFVVSRPHANYADSSLDSFLNSVWKLNSYSSPPGRFSSSIVLSVWQHRIDR
jgi:hypothetical protein